MPKLFCLCLFFSAFLLSATSSCRAQETPSTQPPSEAEAEARAFTFHYGAKITDLPKGAKVRVWIPIAENNPQQRVFLKTTSSPGPLNFGRDAEHQNKIGSFEFTADPTTEPKFELVYEIKRAASIAYREEHSDGSAEKSYSRYLKANRTVPVTGKPVELIKDMAFPNDSTKKGRKLYDLVFDHMTYDKSKPGYGNGDSVWACDSRTGNCTDFHSLFISLSRNQSLAARFEIGFPLPADSTSGKIGGYHCWAWFLSPEQGWIPVDISEADKHPEMKDRLFGYLPPDRVAFSTGRDIVLTPASVAGPKNFFIYPHVEVDGKVWPKESIKLDFSFEDKLKDK